MSPTQHLTRLACTVRGSSPKTGAQDLQRQAFGVAAYQTWQPKDLATGPMGSKSSRPGTARAATTRTCNLNRSFSTPWKIPLFPALRDFCLEMRLKVDRFWWGSCHLASKTGSPAPLGLIRARRLGHPPRRSASMVASSRLFEARTSQTLLQRFLHKPGSMAD